MLLGLLLTLNVLVCLALIAVVLLQRSEGGAFGSGSPTGLITTRGAGDLLTKTTWVLFCMFLTISLAQTIISGRERSSQAILGRLRGERAAPSLFTRPTVPPPAQTGQAGPPAPGATLPPPPAAAVPAPAKPAATPPPSFAAPRPRVRIPATPPSESAPAETPAAPAARNAAPAAEKPAPAEPQVPKLVTPTPAPLAVPPAAPPANAPTSTAGGQPQ